MKAKQYFMRGLAVLALVLPLSAMGATDTNTWQKMNESAPADEPDNRPYSSIEAGDNGMIYYWGGAHHTHPGNDVDVYDVEKNEWRQLTTEESWRDIDSWDHIPEEEKASIKKAFGGGWHVDDLSPMGRPLTKHIYQQITWNPKTNQLCIMNENFFCYDPSMGDQEGAWQNMGNTYQGNDVHTWNLRWDPVLEELVSFQGMNKVDVNAFDGEEWRDVFEGGDYDSEWSEVYSEWDPVHKQHIVYAGTVWGKVDIANKEFTKMSAPPVDWTGPSFSMEWSPALEKMVFIFEVDNELQTWTYTPESDSWERFELAGDGPSAAEGVNAAWDNLERDPQSGKMFFLAATSKDHSNPHMWSFKLSSETDGGGSNDGGTTEPDPEPTPTPKDCAFDTCMGENYKYSNIQKAINNAPDGGVVGVQDGTYEQCATLPKGSAKSVTVRSIDGDASNGRPHFKNKMCNQKSLFVTFSEGRLTLQGLELSGLDSEKLVWADTMPNRGGELILKNMKMHDAGMGLLATNSMDRLEVLNSEFYGMNDPGENGHSIYSRAHNLVVQGNYIHGSVNGHLVKAKSRYADISYNRFVTNGDSPTMIDLWNCGTGDVIGNDFVANKKDSASLVVGITDRHKYGNIVECPIPDEKSVVNVAYNNFKKNGNSLWSSLVLQYNPVDELNIVNNLTENASIYKDGTKDYPNSRVDTGDYNGKNKAVVFNELKDDYSNTPEAVEFSVVPELQYKHPMNMVGRLNVDHMGAFGPEGMPENSDGTDESGDGTDESGDGTDESGDGTDDTGTDEPEEEEKTWKDFFRGLFQWITNWFS